MLWTLSSIAGNWEPAPYPILCRDFLLDSILVQIILISKVSLSSSGNSLRNALTGYPSEWLNVHLVKHVCEFPGFGKRSTFKPVGRYA